MRIEALLAAASALAAHHAEAAQAVMKARHDVVRMTAQDGLAAVLDETTVHADELRAWWTQLHEIGVVRGREASHG